MEFPSGGGDGGYLEHCVYTQGVLERLRSAAEIYFFNEETLDLFSTRKFVRTSICYIAARLSYIRCIKTLNSRNQLLNRSFAHVN